MPEIRTTSDDVQSAPRLHNDVYPFLYPAKFKGSLQDKVTIITGSAGTIGQGLAECFAVAGARVILVYNRTAASDDLADRCEALGAAGVHRIQCDVSDLASCRSLIDQVLEGFGRVDILINNAGANGLAPMHAQEPEDFIHDLAVNLHGPYFLMRLLIPTFRERRSGCVLNIASRAGTLTLPYNTSYCASKAGLINLTGSLQKEFDAEGFDDVHLYSLHPGGIKSTMTLKKYHKDSVRNLPAASQARFARQLDTYNDSPYLNGMACVALATGIAKDPLRGRYVDVNQDLGDVLSQAAALRADPQLHSLHTTFLGGLTKLAPEGIVDPPFDFPGFEEGLW